MNLYVFTGKDTKSDNGSYVIVLIADYLDHAVKLAEMKLISESRYDLLPVNIPEQLSASATLNSGADNILYHNIQRI